MFSVSIMILHNEQQQCYFLAVLIIRDRVSNTSKGFGFIAFETDEDRDDAIKVMDKKVHNA